MHPFLVLSPQLCSYVHAHPSDRVGTSWQSLCVCVGVYTPLTYPVNLLLGASVCSHLLCSTWAQNVSVLIRLKQQSGEKNTASKVKCTPVGEHFQGREKSSINLFQSWAFEMKRLACQCKTLASLSVFHRSSWIRNKVFKHVTFPVRLFLSVASITHFQTLSRPLFVSLSYSCPFVLQGQF